MDKRLDDLIDHIILDGKVTEKERSVLIKRAKELGEDPDEVEIVLEARLFKKIAEQSSVPASGTTIRELLKQIASADDKNKPGLIAALEIPEEKSSYLSFLAYILEHTKPLSFLEQNSYRESTFWKVTYRPEYYERNSTITAWQSKARETLQKGRETFKNDQEIMTGIANYEKRLNRQSSSLAGAVSPRGFGLPLGAHGDRNGGKRVAKGCLIAAGVYLAVMLIIGLGFGLLFNSDTNYFKTDEATEQFEEALASGEYEKALTIVRSLAKPEYTTGRADEVYKAMVSNLLSEALIDDAEAAALKINNSYSRSSAMDKVLERRFDSELIKGSLDNAYHYALAVSNDYSRERLLERVQSISNERGISIQSLAAEEKSTSETQRLSDVELSSGPVIDKIISDVPEILDRKYKALVIGIDDYEGSWPPLQNAVHDATEVANVLEQEYGFEVETILDEQATRKNILSRLENYTESLHTDDNLLIYYSGHGYLKETFNEGYWVPRDTKTSSTVDMISNETIKTIIRSFPSEHVLLISDACFSGKLFRTGTATILREDSTRYYREINKRISRQALTSGGIEPVMDGGRDGHSVFTYYLIKSLKTAEEQIFDTDQLFQRLKIPVSNNSRQTPILSPVKDTGDEGGQFLFIRK